MSTSDAPTDDSSPSVNAPSEKRAKSKKASAQKTLLYVGKVLLIFGVVAGACWMLTKEFKNVKFEQVLEGFHEMRAWKIGLALFLTCIYYLVLTGYDLIALTYMNKSIGLFKVMVGAIIGYAVSHQFGWIFGGTAARYYLYSNWGLRGWEIVKFIAILSLTFWLGLFVMAGVSFTFWPIGIPERVDKYIPEWINIHTTRPLGIAFLIAGALYLTATIVWHKPIKWGGVEIDLPSFRISVLQIVVSAFDFMLAALVFYVLLPKSIGASFPHVLAGYLLAQIIVVSLHVPGGVAVFELVMASALGMHTDTELGHLAAVFFVYRVIYFLFPLVAGLALIGWNEVSKWQKAAQEIAELNENGTDSGEVKTIQKDAEKPESASPPT